MGRNSLRAVGPRLTNAKWQACCRKAEIRSSCDENSDPLELLVTADTSCIDKALAAVQKGTKEDLAAAYYIRGQRKGDPVDYLRALNAAEETLLERPESSAAMFNRALAQEKLGLIKEAKLSWDEVVKRKESGWWEEARKHVNALQQIRDAEWSPDKLDKALERRDRATLTRIVREFPSESMHAFEESDLLDVEKSRLFADILNEPYARAIVNAIVQTKDRSALTRGIRAYRLGRKLELNGQLDKAIGEYELAATLLERVGNPLYVAARYRIVANTFSGGGDTLASLDAITPIAKKHGYRDLYAIHSLRANELEFQSRYLEAYAAYQQAIDSADQNTAAVVAVLSRRSENYARIGSPDLAFRDSFAALKLLPRIADLNARHQANGSAAGAAKQLGYPGVAVQYQNAAVEAVQKAVVDAPAGSLATAKIHLIIALRARADICVELKRDVDARADLKQASDLAKDRPK
jgi:tetratricopeptide (TPR) repeat protein